MIIQCEECSSELSDEASACPKCGAPTLKEMRARIAREHEKGVQMIRRVLVIALILHIFCNLIGMYGGGASYFMIGALALAASTIGSLWLKAPQP
jgi:uncharacterized paraquat-inducible protein A